MGANDKQVGGSHYKSAMVHWDFVEDHGIGYIEGYATRYLMRVKENPLQDAEKALHCVEKLLELNAASRGYTRNPRGGAAEHNIIRFLDTNTVVDTWRREAIYILLKQWHRPDIEAAATWIRKGIRTLRDTVPASPPAVTEPAPITVKLDLDTCDAMLKLEGVRDFAAEVRGVLESVLDTAQKLPDPPRPARPQALTPEGIDLSILPPGTTLHLRGGHTAIFQGRNGASPLFPFHGTISTNEGVFHVSWRQDGTYESFTESDRDVVGWMPTSLTACIDPLVPRRNPLAAQQRVEAGAGAGRKPDGVDGAWGGPRYDPEEA